MNRVVGRIEFALASVILGALCCILPGCGGGKSRSTPAANAPPTTTSPIAVPVQLQAVGKPGYDAAVAKWRGKVVLVDFWATWCEPCVEQLPHTVALAEKLRD